MKELIFIRHAKSDWGSELVKDADRHLSERGYRDAYFMSDWYLKNRKAPALILSSPATRALSTALIFARALEMKMESIVLEDKIYEATAEKLMNIIREQKSTAESFMIFGHNPGFTN